MRPVQDRVTGMSGFRDRGYYAMTEHNISLCTTTTTTLEAAQVEERGTIN
jgi:hypothetical protein